MLSILAIIFGAIQMFERILSTDTHCVVFERNVSDLFFSSVHTDAVDAIRDLPMVDATAPILFGLVSAPDHPVITCFGLTAEDPRLSDAKWIEGQPETFGQETGTVVLGKRAAKFLQANLGEDVEIGSQSFRVSGVVESANGFEDGGVFMPLADAQRFFKRENVVSLVAVKLRSEDDTAAFNEAVNQRFPDLIALENESFGQSYSQFRILKMTAWAVGICALLLGGLNVANTMLLSVLSRIREIAVLRVCGFSRPQVSQLIFTEAGILAGVGIGIGMASGYALLQILKHAPMLQGYISASLPLNLIAAIIVTAFMTTLFGALHPAIYATRIQPAEALRFE